jgi:outer membrane protein OmpA-like peptidoglycan-associated protein
MYILKRVPIFLLLIGFLNTALAQEQDKAQSKLYMDQADEILAVTRALDDARELMITAANFDTTNIKANFNAGNIQILTIGKELSVKYFLRVYRQAPNYRFDIEYWIGQGYQFGLKFDKAISFYQKYKERLSKRPTYAGKDKVEMKEVDKRIQECNNGKEFVASPKPYAITNIGSEINSEFEDYAPVFNADETEIVFTTRRRDGNTNPDVGTDNKPFEDVFVAFKKGGKWGNASNIGPPINTKYSESTSALSPDGNTLFIYRDDNNGDIYVSKKGGDGKWSEPLPLPGVVNSTYREASVSITADGNLIYFASDRPGGYGGSDIYSCTKDAKGEWTRVKNLGPTINTEDEEDGPFISYDGKTLYFSSKGHKGMGDFDIFKSSLTSVEKNDWSEPENIGYPINTPDADVYFTTSKDGKRWYYSSVREDGMGYEDIYVITPVEDKKEPVVAKKEPEPPKKEEPKKETPVVVETPKKEEPKKEEPKIEPFKVLQPIKYQVMVVDAETGTPLDAKVRMQAIKDKTVMGAVDKGEGVVEFSITSKTPKDYRVSVEKEGYIFQNITEKIEGMRTEEKVITKTISMRKIVVGAVSILRNIYFDFNKATFKVESYSELNRLEAMMKQNSGMQVEIGGHTDAIGTKEFNIWLSQRRAEAVKTFLTSKGIDTRRVKTKGYGKEKPLASNDDDKEGRELNRRVEFKVLNN